MTPQEFIDTYALRMDVTPATSNPNMDDIPEGSAHWTVTIYGPGGKMDIPYSMGPGHRRWKMSGARPQPNVPNIQYLEHRFGARLNTADLQSYPVFRGQKPGGPASKPFGGIPLAAAAYYNAYTEPTAPDLPGVLECLSLDWSGVEGQTFEDWASEYGYDTDSRKAERTYRTVLEQANIGRRAFGDAFAVLTSGEIDW